MVWETFSSACSPVDRLNEIHWNTHTHSCLCTDIHTGMHTHRHTHTDESVEVAVDGPCTAKHAQLFTGHESLHLPPAEPLRPKLWAAQI